MDEYEDLPLVYSCSGCSSAAQMANEIAVSLDRRKEAEMSCIAGVGGDVAPLVATAKSDRPVVVIDGCPLNCAESCLERHGVSPDKHYMLTDEGVPKEYHTDFDDEKAEELTDDIAADITALTPLAD